MLITVYTKSHWISYHYHNQVHIDICHFCRRYARLRAVQPSSVRHDNDRRSRDCQPLDGTNSFKSALVSSLSATRRHRSAAQSNDHPNVSLRSVVSKAVDEHNRTPVRDYRGQGHDPSQYFVRSRSADDATCWQRMVSSANECARKMRTPKHERATQLVRIPIVQGDDRDIGRHSCMFRHRRRLNLDEENRRPKSREGTSSTTRQPEISQTSQSSFSRTKAAELKQGRHERQSSINVGQFGFGRQQQQLQTFQPSSYLTRCSGDGSLMDECKISSTAMLKSIRKDTIRCIGRLSEAPELVGIIPRQSGIREESDSDVVLAVKQLKTASIEPTSGTHAEVCRESSATGDEQVTLSGGEVSRLYAKCQRQLSAVSPRCGIRVVSDFDTSAARLCSSMNSSTTVTGISTGVGLPAGIHLKAETCVWRGKIE